MKTHNLHEVHLLSDETNEEQLRSYRVSQPLAVLFMNKMRMLPRKKNHEEWTDGVKDGVVIVSNRIIMNFTLLLLLWLWCLLVDDWLLSCIGISSSQSPDVAERVGSAFTGANLSQSLH